MSTQKMKKKYQLVEKEVLSIKESFKVEGELYLGQSVILNSKGNVEACRPPKVGWIYTTQEDPIGVIIKIDEFEAKVLLLGKALVSNSCPKSDRWRLLEKGEIDSMYLIR